jgi:hypothetical protein
MSQKRKPTTRPRSAASALAPFVALSTVLTGGKVSEATARRHLATLTLALGAPAVRAVLKKFRTFRGRADLGECVATEIIADPVLGPTAKSMTILWFTGLIDGSHGSPGSTQEDYFEALMWPAVGAHPPALSDGYFGHWRYPPDEGG